MITWQSYDPTRMNKMQREAKRILLQLEDVHVPPTGLNYFTVGDSFRTSLFSLKEDILALPITPRSLEGVVIGGFGTGKTHFLSYLNWLLRCDAPKECVISRVDMSDLRDPNEFEFLAVQGLRPAQAEENYARVLRDAYVRIRDLYMARYTGISRSEIEHFYGTLLFLILGQTTKGWVSREMLEILGASDPLEKFLNFLAGKSMQQLFQEAKKNSSEEHGDFVDKYLEMIRHPDMPITAFETPARQLSQRGQLTDVIFKALAFSGIELVVLLVDELESLNRFETPVLRQILVSIRDFRDSLANIGTETSYPPVAFIVATTGAFFDQIRQEEPALHSRWEGKIIPLEFLSVADVDNLIFKLRELYYLAGYSLRSVGIEHDTNPPEHEVIQLREKVIQRFRDSEKPLDMTTRRLIARLIKQVKETWVLSE